MLVSFTIITHNRKSDLEQAIASILAQSYRPIEVIVVDNNSSDGTPELFRNRYDPNIVRYVRLHENTGVSGGRNITIDKTKGEIIVTLDDDAEIVETEATQRIVNKLQTDKSIGLLAFKVLVHATGMLQKGAFPTRDKSLSPDEEFETTRFIGVGHAAPRALYDEIGLYRDFFPYGHEELDFSFRILDAGYKIIYFPQVTITHKLEGTRRQRLQGKWHVLLENRVKAALLNLPLRYVASTGLIWSIRYWLDAGLNPLPVLNGWYNLYTKRHKLKTDRTPIKQQTVARLRVLKGPLLY